MNAFRIMVAGQVAEILSEYRPASSLYADYRTNRPCDFQIILTDEDLDTELYGDKKKIVIKPPVILKKMADGLLNYDILLFHGAILAHQDRAYLFTAPSRTGKTTHIIKWLEHLPDAYVVNGDKPFIKFSDDGTPPLACGSPWAGKENLYTNTMVPLKSIILMERAEENRIEQISFAQVFPALLQQTYRPDDEEKMRKTLRLMQRLSPAVSFWRFQCNNFKDDCFDVAYNALVKGQP